MAASTSTGAGTATRPEITEDIFGTTKDPLSGETETIRRFTFANRKGMVVQVITWGATITSIQVPDAKGAVEDVVLGFDEIGSYVHTKTDPYFGAAVGRVANRIANGRFFLNGQQIEVSKNLMEKHTLHGGFIGFNRVNWAVGSIRREYSVLKLQHVSPNGHEGFPGQVTAIVRYRLTNDNSFHINFEATTTKPTPINLTNHSYFNLAGHGAGKGALFDHVIEINSDKITITDGDSIPTGEFKDVEGTPYDFREQSELGLHMMEMGGKGFDHNFCLNEDPEYKDARVMVARASYPKNGRWLEVFTNQPGIQFYTANFLPLVKNMERPLIGKQQANYVSQCAFCLEPQKFPDAVNHPNFPSIILKPGETYEHKMCYKFGIEEPQVEDIDKSSTSSSFTYTTYI